MEGGKRLTIPADVPKPLAELIARCWDQEPSKRPAMLEVVNILAPLAAEDTAAASHSAAEGILFVFLFIDRFQCLALV